MSKLPTMVVYCIFYILPKYLIIDRYTEDYTVKHPSCLLYPDVGGSKAVHEQEVPVTR